MANAIAHQRNILEIQKNSSGSYLDLELLIFVEKNLNSFSWVSPFNVTVKLEQRLFT